MSQKRRSVRGLSLRLFKQGDQRDSLATRRVEENFSYDCVSLEWLFDVFWAKHCKTHHDKTIQDVFEEIIKKEIKGMSYTTHLKQTDKRAVKSPIESVRLSLTPRKFIFVSQARQTNFNSLIEALQSRSESSANQYRKDKTYVWMDIFSINQFQMEGASGKVLGEKFHDAIGKFDAFWTFFDSWSDPKPLTRLWCIWEIYGAIVKDRKIELLVPKDQEVKLLESPTNSNKNFPILQEIIELRPSDATCHLIEDERKIRLEVESSVGWARLKMKVTRELTAWILSCFDKSMEKNGAKPEELESAGNIAKSFDRLSTANRYFRSAYDSYHRKSLQDPNNISVQIGLVRCLRKQLETGGAESMSESWNQYIDALNVVGYSSDEGRLEWLCAQRNFYSYENMLLELQMSEIFYLRPRLEEPKMKVLNLCSYYENLKESGADGLLSAQDHVDWVVMLVRMKTALNMAADALTDLEQLRQILVKILENDGEKKSESKLVQYPQYVEMMLAKGECLMKVGEISEALSCLQSLEDTFVESLGSDEHSTIAEIKALQAKLKNKQGDYDNAMRLACDAIDLCSRLKSPDIGPPARPAITTELVELKNELLQRDPSIHTVDPRALDHLAEQIKPMFYGHQRIPGLPRDFIYRFLFK